MLGGGTLILGLTSFRTPPLPYSSYSYSSRVGHKRGLVKAGEMSPKRPLFPSSSAFCTPSLQILATAAVAAAASAAIFSVAAEAGADLLTIESQQQRESESETLSNIPQTLSGECISGKDDCKKPRIQRPKSRKAEICTVKCVNTCIRGGLGSPGEGPLNVRRPLVVFKQGFRSRQYCLVECSDICNLIGDGDDGP